jgi:hypothetical protein
MEQRFKPQVQVLLLEIPDDDCDSCARPAAGARPTEFCASIFFRNRLPFVQKRELTTILLAPLYLEENRVD